MWQLILNFLGGPIISGLLSAYKARLQSIDSSDQKALELLEAEIAAETAARAQATQLLIAEQGNLVTRMIRPLFALPFIVYECKIVIWDKVLAMGTTDALDPHMWSVFTVVVASYFGATAIERVSKIFKR